MAYQVTYGPSCKKQCIKDRNRSGWIKIAGVCVVIAGLLLIPGVRNLLIPGDVQVTKSAVSDFSSELKEGRPLGEAITTFCKEILEGADIS